MKIKRFWTLSSLFSNFYFADKKNLTNEKQIYFHFSRFFHTFYVLFLLARTFSYRNKELEGKFSYQIPILQIQKTSIRWVIRTMLTCRDSPSLLGNGRYPDIWTVSTETRYLIFSFIFKNMVWLGTTKKQSRRILWSSALRFSSTQEVANGYFLNKNQN